MTSVKVVEFTVARNDIWPWLKTVVCALWHGRYQVRLHMDTANQTLIWEPAELEKDT